jgi:endonuclease YncB( thermonuclease family)
LKSKFLLLFSVFVCTLIFNSQAQSTLRGKAVRILDGDTFELLVNGNATYKVRLTDIDAPEKGQDFGQVSKQALSDLLKGNDLQVTYDKLDRNNRILGHVYQGNNYVNLEMVKQGMAWHYKKYSSDERFARAEYEARQKKRGLWILNAPIAPWEFRANRRKRS